MQRTENMPVRYGPTSELRITPIHYRNFEEEEQEDSLPKGKLKKNNF